MDEINKDDKHLEPTEIQQDKNQVKPSEEAPDLSHEETEKRLDLYSRIGDRSEQYFDVQRIAQKYRQELDDRKQNRTKSDIHYAQGIRSGLPHEDIADIQKNREQQDQLLRNDVVKEAKTLYDKNTSLRKAFESKNAKKNKGIEPEP